VREELENFEANQGQKVSMLQKDVNQKEALIQELSDSVKAKDEKIQNLEQKLEKLTHLHQNHQTSAAAEKEQLVNLITKRDDIIKQKAAELAEMTKKSDRLASDNNRITKEAERLTSDLATATRTLEIEHEKMEMAMSLRKSEYENTDKLLGARVAELNAAHEEMSALKNEGQQYKKEINDMQTKLDEQAQAYSELQAHHDALNDVHSALKGSCDELKKDLTETQGQLEQERALKEAVRKRHEISVTQLAGAAAERENLIRAVKKLQSVIEDMKEARAKLISEFEETHRTYKRIEDQGELERQENNERMSTLQKEVAQLERTKAKNEKMIENIENERDLLQVDLLRCQKDNDELRQQSTQAASMYKMSLNTLTIALEQERMRVEEQKKLTNKTQDLSKDQLKNVYEKHDQLTHHLQQRYEELVNEVVTLNHKFAEALDTLQKSQEHCAQLQQQIENAQKAPSAESQTLALQKKAVAQELVSTKMITSMGERMQELRAAAIVHDLILQT
jgi:chromosome segregation ATPase